MKANEAPERLYLSKTIYSTYLYQVPDPDDETAVEYTRTDAFIKMALDYIENNIYDHYDGDHEYGICGGYVKKEEFIEKFINHMRGE